MMPIPISTNWTTILADLSLVLFIVTASALANAPASPFVEPPHAGPSHATASRPAVASPQAEPVAVWTEGPGAPPLGTWLAEQARDPRLRATIVVRYRGSDLSAPLAHAVALGQAAGARGRGARIVVEAGAGDAASVTLGFDAENAHAPASAGAAGAGTGIAWQAR